MPADLTRASFVFLCAAQRTYRAGVTHTTLCNSAMRPARSMRRTPLEHRQLADKLHRHELSSAACQLRTVRQLAGQSAHQQLDMCLCLCVCVCADLPNCITIFRRWWWQRSYRERAEAVFADLPGIRLEYRDIRWPMYPEERHMGRERYSAVIDFW